MIVEDHHPVVGKELTDNLTLLVKIHQDILFLETQFAKAKRISNPEVRMQKLTSLINSEELDNLRQLPVRGFSEYRKVGLGLKQEIKAEMDKVVPQQRVRRT